MIPPPTRYICRYPGSLECGTASDSAVGDGFTIQSMTTEYGFTYTRNTINTAGAR